MPNSVVDLHLHSYYSDGRASPAELLHYAAGSGLKTVAITDHDNLGGAHEAANVARQDGLELIPGIELTCRWESCTASPSADEPEQDVDLLGYFIDPDDPGLRTHTKLALEDLRQRVADCCQRITAAGYPVSIYEVLDENPRYPGAMQLISALQRKGYARSWNEAYPIFARHWPQVPRSRFTIAEGIAVLHAAGGVAVLAHPVAVRCDEGLLDRQHLAALVDMGLDGLEVLHPRLDTPARQHFSGLAKEFDLLVSGGSDEHGWPGGFSRMGSELVSYKIVDALRQRSLSYQT